MRRKIIPIAMLSESPWIDEFFRKDARTVSAPIEKKTGYNPPEGFNGFQKHTKKGRGRRY